MQGQSVGALVDGSDDVCGGGESCLQQERRHRCCVLDAQPLEPDLLGAPLGQEPRPPVTQGCSGRRLIAPVDADDKKGQLAAGSSELGDGFEGDVVGPLQVLELEDRRAIDPISNALDEIEDEHPAVCVAVRSGLIAAGQKLIAQVRERRVLPHRPK